MIGLFKSRKKMEDDCEQLYMQAKIPLLLNYGPFKDVIKHASNPKIKKEMQILQSMVEEEKKHILEVNSLHKEKSRITASILYLSNQLNESGSRNSAQDLEMRKRRMKDIIEDIKNREEEIRILRDKQEHQNLVLLKETVEYAYENMKRDERELEVLLKDIEKQREKLQKDREKRDLLKSRLDSMYGFMHAMMGARETEKFDSEFFEDDES